MHSLGWHAFARALELRQRRESSAQELRADPAVFHLSAHRCFNEAGHRLAIGQNLFDGFS